MKTYTVPKGTSVIVYAEDGYGFAETEVDCTFTFKDLVKNQPDSKKMYIPQDNPGYMRFKLPAGISIPVTVGTVGFQMDNLIYMDVWPKFVIQ